VVVSIYIYIYQTACAKIQQAVYLKWKIEVKKKIKLEVLAKEKKRK
jgi:hypothetical protein